MMNNQGNDNNNDNDNGAFTWHHHIPQDACVMHTRRVSDDETMEGGDQEEQKLAMMLRENNYNRTLLSSIDDPEILQLHAEEQHYEHACSVWFAPPEGRVSQELASLSKEEREQVWSDLSGNAEVSHACCCNCDCDLCGEEDDDYDMLQCKRDELDQLLDQHALHHQEDALSIALHQNRAYVTDLPFLSSQKDVQNAYAAMQEHFQMKQDLFGDDCLGRDVTIQDMDGGDRTLQCLYSGAYQVSPPSVKDKMGRAFSILNVSYRNDENMEQPFTREEILRCMFYLNMLLLRQDPTVQKTGVVRTGYCHHDSYPPDGPDNEFLREAINLLGSLPIKTVALYLVVSLLDSDAGAASTPTPLQQSSQRRPALPRMVSDREFENSPWFQSAELLVLMINSQAIRLRTRIIHGTFNENMYTLQCVGLPVMKSDGNGPSSSSFPLQANGQPITKVLHAWLQEQEKSNKRPRDDDDDDDAYKLPH